MNFKTCKPWEVWGQQLCIKFQPLRTCFWPQVGPKVKIETLVKINDQRIDVAPWCYKLVDVWMGWDVSRWGELNTASRC